MKVVVFGGAGFLGSHVCDILSEQGHEVVIFDAKKSPYRQKRQQEIIGDVLDADKVKKALKGVDYVYHFAGLADLDDAQTKPMDTAVQNINGTINILEACKQEGIKRFLYASTVYVYSEKGGFYRCSKQAAESYIEEYQKSYGLNYTILRYGTLYGPRANEHNSIYRYLSQALTAKTIECSSSGEEVREYIYVRDAAELSVQVLDEKHQNKHIIITGHHPMKFKDFLNMINEILGGQLKIKYNIEPADSSHYNITPYSFRTKIGYKLTSTSYLDMGQGILECIYDINSRSE